MKHYLQKLAETASTCWDRKALCNFHGEEFTFGQVASSIEKFHILFQGGGISKGDHIAICAKNTARWAISFLAVNTYEAVAVPILADFLPGSVCSLVDHSESVLLFTDPDIWKNLDPEKMPRLRAAISVKDFSLLFWREGDGIKKAYETLSEAFAARYPMGFSRENISYPTDNADDLAVINYTSGTTSSPKGVMLRYGSFTATVQYAQDNVTATPDDTIVSMLPMAHMYGLAFEFIYPLCSGVTIYYLGKTPSPTLLLKAMQEVRPYMMVTVPLVMEKIYKSSIKPALSKGAVKFFSHIPIVRRIVYRQIGRRLDAAFGGRVHTYIMGGAALNPEVEKVLRRIGLRFTVGYGMTEACPLLAYSAPETFVPGSCGRPVSCATVRIDSEDPEHMAGEIQARGENICIGYWHNDEASSAAFTPDGFLRTGDLGIMDAAGNLFIRGRSKSMILSANGQNIYPEELEAILNARDYIAESVVVDRAGKIVALVYLDSDRIRRDGLDEEAVSDIPENTRIAVNRQLPAYSQIAKVEVMPTPFEKTPKMSIKRFLYS